MECMCSAARLFGYVLLYLTGLGTEENRQLSLQIEIRECLMLFAADYFAFQSDYQKYKD